MLDSDHYVADPADFSVVDRGYEPAFLIVRNSNENASGLVEQHPFEIVPEIFPAFFLCDVKREFNVVMAQSLDL